MAPVVSLPIPETPCLPDMQTTKLARWADVEDCTPSPCTEYPLPDLKQVWPPTPTPLDAICDSRLPCLLTQAFLVPSEVPLHCTRDSDLTVQTIEGSFPALAQTFPEMLVPSANFPMAFSIEDPQMVMHAPDTWGCDLHNSSCVSAVGIYGMQWPSFAPQQHSDPLPLSVQWPNVNEDIEKASQLEVHTSQLSGQWPTFGEGVSRSTQLVAAQPAPSATDALTESESQKSLRHSTGQCRPCAWFYRPSGCKNAEACGYCHLCPAGELKARKKNKIVALRTGALAPATAGGGWGLKLDSLIQE